MLYGGNQREVRVVECDIGLGGRKRGLVDPHRLNVLEGTGAKGEHVSSHRVGVGWVAEVRKVRPFRVPLAPLFHVDPKLREARIRIRGIGDGEQVVGGLVAAILLIDAQHEFPGNIVVTSLGIE